MCGIVGLFLKTERLEPDFGALMAAMLETMTDRGPDSAGFAVYGKEKRGRIKVTVRAASDEAAAALAERLAETGAKTSVRGSHIVAAATEAELASLQQILAEDPGARVVASGKRMEIYKEVGLPADVAARFGLAEMRGTHGVGHTRMATESAVTTDGAHPFTTGTDQCLVHNGSLSNHNSWRRRLRAEGVAFGTDNDSEVAAGYLTWRMREEPLGAALEHALADLDGFYTFVVGTERGFGVLRDPIACKPAVMAETDEYVAFGSEYRALVDLPGVEKARVWEPEPATAYFWERAA